MKRREAEWRVYPPKKKQYAYSDGDDVFVRSKDGKKTYRGKIRMEHILHTKDELKKFETKKKQKGLTNVGSKGAAPSANQTSQSECNSSTAPSAISILSVFLSEEQTFLQLSEKEQTRRLIPNFTHKTLNIVVTPETNYFRILAKQVTNEDRILEIGCSTGETSKLLIPNCLSWVGLDTSEQMIEQCKATVGKDTWDEKRCYATVVDALIDPIKAEKECSIHGSITVVFIDIGGNRECINVLRMLSWVLEKFVDLRLVVVKSRELTQSIKTTASVADGTGIVENGYDWFLKHQKNRALPKHPLKAPMVTSPKGEPICRYYNYHKEGCNNADCPYDHEYCHFCLKKGHVARNCPTLNDSCISPLRNRRQEGDETKS